MASTYSQSRTCCPPPYGSGCPSSVQILKGTTFSGNWSGPSLFEQLVKESGKRRLPVGAHRWSLAALDAE